jgi:glycosyltransferase involved in cell wall biosynthesis
MNVSMISEHASPLATLGGVDAGGQNVHVAALAREIARAGNTVSVYTRRDDVHLAERVAMEPGVTVVHVPAGPPHAIGKDEMWRHMDVFAKWVIDDLDTHPADVLHSHFWMSGYVGLAARHATGLPLVHTFHALAAEKRKFQGAADTSPDERIAIETRIAREADRIVATASAEAFELVRMGTEAARIKVVPCGVDLAAFRPDGPSEPRDRDLFRIVTLSRLVPRKGIADVVEALASIDGAELIVAGGPPAAELARDPEAQRLAALARERGVSSRVSLRGGVARAEVPALLRSADVVVCAPWYEPFGIVPLEAMACGTPLVVSAVGGLIDTVVDGVTGMHVHARAPEELALALQSLRADATRRAAFARAGIARVQRRHSWKRIANETLDVYRNVLAAVARRTQALG